MDEPKSTAYRISDDPIIRFCTFYMFLWIGSLILGRVGVFEIVVGLIIISTRVLIRFPYFQAYIRRFFGSNQPELISNQPHSWFSKIPSIVISLLIICFYVSVGALFIWMGIKELLENGFLNQNLIYILFFKFK